MQTFLELGHVGGDLNVDVRDQLALWRQKGKRGAPRRLAQHIDRTVRQRRDVGDARVCNRQFAKRNVAFDDDCPVHRNGKNVGGLALHHAQDFRLNWRQGRGGGKRPQIARNKESFHVHVICPFDHASVGS